MASDQLPVTKKNSVGVLSTDEKYFVVLSFPSLIVWCLGAHDG